MAEEKSVFEPLAICVVFAYLAPVVEENADDAAFYLDVIRIGVDRIDAFEEV